MELLFSQNRLGRILVSHELLDTLVTRHLPEGVMPLSIRFRHHDKLCLVMLSDRRSTWDPQSDRRSADAIVQDLKALGVERPRLQWVRATSEAELHELKLRQARLPARPLFWALTASLVMSLFLMPFSRFFLTALVTGLIWKGAHWLLREEGWDAVKKTLPEFLRSALK